VLKTVASLQTIIIASIALAACSNSQFVSPEDVQPVYQIRNTPLPVPDPKWKPRGTTHAPKKSVTPKKRAAAKPRSASAIQGKRHSVRKGETLYGLSKRYSVPLRSLISANKLRAPYVLAVGQRLLVPSARVHTVRKGETGYGISRRYGVTASALMRANGIKAPYRLAVGQKLRLPGGATAKATSAKVPVRRSAVANKQPTGRTVKIPRPAPRSKAGFLWPVKGALASRFGPREGGLHNDGINIIADSGTAIKAADAGVVVYASNALEGYGNLLLVKHSGGWITAYAHTERLLVRPGQKVRRGEIVARVGSTGGVTAPQLHFEIRKGRQAIDPLKYLPLNS